MRDNKRQTRSIQDLAKPRKSSKMRRFKWATLTLGSTDNLIERMVQIQVINLMRVR